MSGNWLCYLPLPAFSFTFNLWSQTSVTGFCGLLRFPAAFHCLPPCFPLLPHMVPRGILRLPLPYLFGSSVLFRLTAKGNNKIKTRSRKDTLKAKGNDERPRETTGDHGRPRRTMGGNERQQRPAPAHRFRFQKLKVKLNAC